MSRIKLTYREEGLLFEIAVIGIDRIHRLAAAADGHYGGRRFWHAALAEARASQHGDATTLELQHRYAATVIAAISSAKEIRRVLRFMGGLHEQMARREAELAGEPPVDLWALERDWEDS